ncbi:Bor family protein [Flavisericum labens]|uniref:Bor family protein n=1 Tax=Flavisericum labens TaxID=3377112 RepID=UPI00387B8522
MIKKTLKLTSVAFAASILLTSCYSYTSVVGSGSQGNNEVTKWNHYLIGGLAPVGVSDSKQMANGSENYTVHTRLSFVNGLVSSITFGLYSPTTTTVKY